jgi:hypothetical protein
MRKIAAKWVPHELNEVQKWTRYEACRVNLERYEIEGDNFLNRIIAIDETWSRAYETELSRMPMKRERILQERKLMSLSDINGDIYGTVVQHLTCTREFLDENSKILL